jgi:WD40 repeat protein
VYACIPQSRRCLCNSLLGSNKTAESQVWDVRVQRSVRSIFGPYVCGNSLDICNSTLVSASWRSHDQLQTWDLGSGKLVSNLPVHAAEGSTLKLYALSVSPEGLIVTGGSSEGASCVRVRSCQPHGPRNAIAHDQCTSAGGCSRFASGPAIDVS